MIQFGVIGFGYWGPNVARNIQCLDNARLLAICDNSTAALRRAAQSYPNVQRFADASDIIFSAEIDAVAVITPVCTHFELAKAALQNGKHVFVEKPFTSTAAEAEELIELAERNRLKIMVDHTF